MPVEGDARSFSRPQFLPGGERILSNDYPSRQAVVHSLATGQRQVLLENASDVRYLPTGHLAYVLNGTLLAVPFDAEQGTITGGPVSLVEQIAQHENGFAQWAHSDDGTLVYVSAGGRLGRSGHWSGWIRRPAKRYCPYPLAPISVPTCRLTDDGSRWSWKRTHRISGSSMWSAPRDVG